MSLLLLFGGSAVAEDAEVEEAPHTFFGTDDLPFVFTPPQPVIVGRGRIVFPVCTLRGVGTVTSPDDALLGLELSDDAVVLEM